MLERLLENDSLAWLVLTASTLLSWFLFEDTHASTIAYTIILLSSVKVYVIGVSFMEVFQANRVFIQIFHMWTAMLTLLFCWAY